MELKPSVVVNGMTWDLYSVDYRTMDDQTFSVYIYALSKEHASYLVEELKGTAKLGSKIVGFRSRK